MDELGSDHKPILIEMKCNRERKSEKKNLTWAWRKADWAKYEVECEKRKDVQLNEGLASKVRQLTEITLEAAKASIPRKVASKRNRPYWDEELDKLNKERNSYRRKGSIDIDKWKEKTEELNEKVARKKREYWREFVGNLKEEEDSKKVWKTIKTLSTGNKADTGNEILIDEERELRTDKQKANCFAKKYAEVNRIKIKKEERAKRVEVEKRLSEMEEDEEMKKPLDLEEMRKAIDQMEEGKKGGTDEVETAMLTRMPEGLRRRWLEVYNESWRKGRTPGEWKKAEIIPILKAGKDPKKTDSFRPVSLTSVLAKLLERMVANRLWFWMERTKCLIPWQAGFQRGRSTEEQVNRIIQDIQDGWEEREHLKTIVVTLDCSKAYDKVWRIRLIERMIEEGVPVTITRWINSFLEGRKARARVNGGRSEWKYMKEGLPQGAVSSPMLFLLYANEWGGMEEEGVNYSGFADDLAIWATGRKVEEVKQRVQRALDKVERWAQKAKIMLNPTKSESCLYTRDNREKGAELNLTINGGTIVTHKEVLFLGVIIDQGLNFHKQIDKVCRKAKKRIAVLKALTGREWGWGRAELRKVYKVVVESCFWYASAAWMPWVSNSEMEKMERVQREALRVVTGLAISTPKEIVYLEAEETPLAVEAKRRAMIMFEKAVRGREEDPRRKMCEKRGRIRLASNKGWREQARRECDRVVGGPRQKFCWERRPPWNSIKNRGVQVNLDMKEKVKKGSTSEEEMRRVSKETVTDLGPFEMVVATDGSVEDGTKNGGGACVTEWEGENIVIRRAAGRWCSSFVAEKVAMMTAVELIKEKRPRSALVMSDSQALLRVIKEDKHSLDTRLEELFIHLWEAAEHTRIVIQWVPSHVGITENEWADNEANKARAERQDDIEIEFKCAKRRICREIRKGRGTDERTGAIYSNGVKRADKIHRKAQVVLAQLRAGHCSETAYYKHRIGAREDAICEDCNDIEQKDHWMVCPRWDRARQEEGVSEIRALAEEDVMLRLIRKVKPKWIEVSSQP